MTDGDLLDTERQLRAAVASARERGWRIADLEQAAPGILDRRYRDLFGRLDGGLDEWRLHHRLSAEGTQRIVSTVLLMMRLLPALVEVAEPVRSEGIDGTLLARVRALLAKAESTTFPAEAEALTAKAHELIARYAIAAALLEGREVTSEVRARRIMIDAPYAKARFLLLGQVTRACSCRALWQEGLGFASSAMTASSPKREAPSNTAAFRRAFLYSFGGRVGQRLRDINAAAADAAVRHDLLPALASRRDAVDAAVDAAAPDAKSVSFSASDHRGWRSGRDARGVRDADHTAHAR